MRTRVLVFVLAATLVVTAALSRGAVSTERFTIGPPVFCLMVTGKDDSRISYARGSVRNFLGQTYENKQLVIVNHHETRSVLNGGDLDGVTEVRVSKAGRTLGDLRNVCLSYVRPGAIWTTWDDDDVRRADYLSVLFGRMVTTGADVVLYTRRFEYNVNTDLAYTLYLPDGCWIFFAKHDANYRYDSLDTREDNAVKAQLTTLNKSVDLFDNPPSLYIRLVHTNNTSTAVDPTKQTLAANEQAVQATLG